MRCNPGVPGEEKQKQNAASTIRNPLVVTCQGEVIENHYISHRSGSLVFRRALDSAYFVTETAPVQSTIQELRIFGPVPMQCEQQLSNSDPVENMPLGAGTASESAALSLWAPVNDQDVMEAKQVLMIRIGASERRKGERKSRSFRDAATKISGSKIELVRAQHGSHPFVEGGVVS